MTGRKGFKPREVTQVQTHLHSIGLLAAWEGKMLEINPSDQTVLLGRTAARWKEGLEKVLMHVGLNSASKFQDR